MPRFLPAGFVAPCQPSPAPAPPAGVDWLHEIKHDGFRLMVRRDGDRVRLFTRNGHDWAARYPAIVAAAAAINARSFLIDGEVVVADARGVASFALLRGQARETEAFVWAFDLLELEGENLRALPLERRKGELKALLKRAPSLFAQACATGLEGIVSKRASSPYRSGRSPHWLKAKNPESPVSDWSAYWLPTIMDITATARWRGPYGCIRAPRRLCRPRLAAHRAQACAARPPAIPHTSSETPTRRRSHWDTAHAACRGRVDDMIAAGPINTDYVVEKPLVRLVRELAARVRISTAQ